MNIGYGYVTNASTFSPILSVERIKAGVILVNLILAGKGNDVRATANHISPMWEEVVK
jgi:hypothetical protein